MKTTHEENLRNLAILTIKKEELEAELKILKSDRYRPINIILDYKDADPLNVVFVEIEDDQGRSIRVGGELLEYGQFHRINITLNDLLTHREEYENART